MANEMDGEMKAILMKIVIVLAWLDILSKLWAQLGQAQDERDWSDSGDVSESDTDGSEPVAEESVSDSDELAEVALIVLVNELIQNVRVFLRRTNKYGTQREYFFVRV